MVTTVLLKYYYNITIVEYGIKTMVWKEKNNNTQKPHGYTIILATVLL